MSAKNTSLQNHWKKRLEQWRSSGRSPRSWCQEHGVTIHTFYYWRRKLMPIAQIPPAELNQFVELVDDEPSASGLSIECQGVTIHLSRDFHEQSLISCLNILRGV